MHYHRVRSSSRNSSKLLWRTSRLSWHGDRVSPELWSYLRSRNMELGGEYSSSSFVTSSLGEAGVIEQPGTWVTKQNFTPLKLVSPAR
jgi:hypothetical protein